MSAEPLVSIVVTSYCPESKKYLDLCMRSIANLSYKNIETIVVGRPDYLPWYEGAMTVSPPEQEFWNGRGINFGVEHASGEYLFIVNDDVILTRDCIQPLIKALEIPQIGQVMPAGNDQQMRYYWPHAALFFEQNKNNHHELMLMDGQVALHQQMVFADTLCLYAHMVSRKLWDKVGPMDDDSGLIDIDYSIRMRQAGLLNAIEFGSLVWHFGGSSVVHTLDTPKRIKQKEQFQAKWGFVP